MKLTLIIQIDATQYGEKELATCRTVDIYLTDHLMDTKHERIIGVEVEKENKEEKVND